MQQELMEAAVVTTVTLKRAYYTYFNQFITTMPIVSFLHARYLPCCQANSVAALKGKS